MLADIQKVRLAMGNRVGAMERDGLSGEWTAPVQVATDELAAIEAGLKRYLEQQMKRHPLAPWIKEQRGIGLPSIARLLGTTGPLDKFATVSKLWAYLGLHVVDGAAPQRVRGVRSNYSPQGRVLCYLIGEAIVKSGKGGEYREAYDRKKAEYEANRPDWPQVRRHNAARRYAVKRFLLRIWVEWRRVMREQEAPDAR